MIANSVDRKPEAVPLLTKMLRRSSITRTPFKHRTSEKRFSSFSHVSGKGTARVPGTARYSTLNRFGKKAKLREKINRPLRAKFRKLGLIDVCEAKLPECWNKDLTWMHGKKDRLLTMSERKNLVIRACSVCHGIVELWGHERMLEFVQNVINNRSKEREAV